MRCGIPLRTIDKSPIVRVVSGRVVGTGLDVKLSRQIQRRIRHSERGLDIVADVNAAVAASVNETGPDRTSVASHQTVVQRQSAGKPKTHDEEARHDGRAP
jgi:hypothetical protein